MYISCKYTYTCKCTCTCTYHVCIDGNVFSCTLINTDFQRLVQQWRKSLEQALESLDTWIKYYKAELGVTLLPVPKLDTGMCCLSL